MKHNLALAYSMKKKKKMAKGGECGCFDGSCPKCMAAGGEIKDQDRMPSESALGHSSLFDMGSEATKSHQIQRFDDNGKPYSELYAKGGCVCDDGSCSNCMSKSKKMAKNESYSAYEPDDTEEDKADITPYTQTDKNRFAHGGDIVEIVMKKRKKMSEGGMVSNEDKPMADSMPAEYDDLELNDHLEGKNSGKADGDMDGDAQEDEDRHDIVRRIMKSRMKKDRMPRPA